MKYFRPIFDTKPQRGYASPRSQFPRAASVHVILDNYATHKNNDGLLALQLNVHFHFTPTSESWLNQVEIGFGIFTPKSLA